MQDPNNLQRKRELQREEERFRLQQAESRLDIAKRNAVFVWIINGIYLLVGLLELLLILRFILRLFGANTQNTFAQTIYNLSEPFMAPFSTLFISPVSGGGTSIFDINVLVAIVVYGLLCFVTVSIVRFLMGR